MCRAKRHMHTRRIVLLSASHAAQDDVLQEAVDAFRADLQHAKSRAAALEAEVGRHFARSDGHGSGGGAGGPPPDGNDIGVPSAFWKAMPRYLRCPASSSTILELSMKNRIICPQRWSKT